MRELKRFKLFTVFFFVLLLTISCREDKLGDPIIVSNIKKEFYLDIAEILGPGQRSTQFKVQTIEDGECLNGTIDFDFIRQGNRLTVSLNEVVIPEDCIPGIAPSSADVTAGALTAGFYLFNFNLRNAIKNNGTLVVEDGRYLLELESEDGVILLHKEVFRVPENFIWGYIAYDDSDLNEDAQNIYNQLIFHGVDPDLEKGFYGFFSINDTESGMEINDAPEVSHLRPFAMIYDGDWNYMKGLADNLATSHPEVLIKMFDDKGRSF